ncbi:MAG TPA: DUF5667 domain-containing protein [Dehalococcoidia bacterium]|nr:DUF5667 domain-containing protein [Dehalococcoidia bacterium]
MTQGDLRDALDDCLARMAEGASVDDVLERYPGLASELRPLLVEAQRLRDLELAQPDPAARAANRLRFLRRGAELRRAHQQRSIRSVAAAWLRRSWQPSRTRIAHAVTSFVLVFASAGGLTAWAATGAGADSPLYSVKILIEDARLRFASDGESRADLLLDLLGERNEELRDLLAEGKTPSGRFLDRLESTSRQAAESIAEIEDAQVRQRADQLLSEEVRLLTRMAPRMAGDQGERVSQLWEAASSQRVALVASTSRPSATPPAPPPSAGDAAVRVVLGSARRVEVGAASPAMVQDGAVEIAGETYRVAPGVELPPDGAGRVIIADTESGETLVIGVESVTDPAATSRVQGSVSEATSSDFWVGGQRVVLEATTIVTGGPIAPGARVLVEGLADVNGDLRASEVQVVPADDAADITTFAGIVIGREGQAWRIQDETQGEIVLVEDGGAELDLRATDGAPAVGFYAQGEAVAAGDGILTILTLRLSLPPVSATPSPEVTPDASPTPTGTPEAEATTDDAWTFEGVVASYVGDVLSFNSGTTVRLPATLSLPTLGPGDIVIVGLVNVPNDLPLVASLQLVEEAIETATPTPTPTASPEPSPTAEPPQSPFSLD